MFVFYVSGGKPLKGTIKVSGAKNVAMKAIVAALLTKDRVTVNNIPLISSVTGTAQIIKHLNGTVKFASNNSVTIDTAKTNKGELPLEYGGLYRTTTMTIGPLLHRVKHAVVPNPGGCRLGKRPIDMHISGLKAMGARISYRDGFFRCTAAQKLTGCRFKFAKNTHTGTETLILAGVLAQGRTILENAASEPEIDDLIRMLNSMGAKIKRVDSRTIRIDGVQSLHGTNYTIMPDRNEAVTFAIAAYVTKGKINIKGIASNQISSFLTQLDRAQAPYEIKSDGIIFTGTPSGYLATDVVTASHPGFMTDWQQPWAVLALLSKGTSTIHETVFESRFSYVSELQKMGAKIDFFHPKVRNPKSFYNFNWEDRKPDSHQAIAIRGPQTLHRAVVEIHDLRAGATLVLSALAAKGESVLFGIEHLERGYENIVDRINNLGGNIKRVHKNNE